MTAIDPDRFEPDLELEAPFSVRVGTRADLQELVHVESLSQGAPWTERVFEKEFGLDFSKIWIVDWDEEGAAADVAAYLIFWIVHDEVHVLNVVTHPSARRRGLARSLMDELVRLAEQERASIISLEVRVGNEAAQALYRSMGFIPIGTRENYYADNYEDADVLALILKS